MSEFKNYIDKIVNKKFGVRTKGYDPEEVDFLFDDIIEKLKAQYDQITSNEEETSKLQTEIETLNQTIAKLEMDNASLKSNIDQINKSGYQNHNIMQRLNSLEEQISTQSKPKPIPPTPKKKKSIN